MNCHHARQLISPYLDQQLTGREMLALQDHFAGCLSCEREMQSIRQVKALLRGLREPRTPRDFSSAIALRLTQSEAGAHGWRVLSLPVPLGLPTPISLAKPQRGRRLASALAISCLTVLSFALPFGPEARDAARSSLFGSGSGSAAFAVPAPTDVLLSGRVPERITLMPAGDISRFSPAEAAAPQPAGPLMLTGMDTPPAPSLETTRDAPFDGIQFAVFRPR